MAIPSFFIIVKGQPKALLIEKMELDERGVYAIKYKNSPKTYHYRGSDVICIQDAVWHDHLYLKVYINNREQRNVSDVRSFNQGNLTHWRITYSNGYTQDYLDGTIKVVKSCLEDKVAKNAFEYLKRVAQINELGKDEENGGILPSLYQNIDFIDESLTAAPYLDANKYKPHTRCSSSLFFPFGCNASQSNAVKNAFEKQISVIQGPPGTGKTQTILNIIANILMRDQTVMVVSNNNSATTNVFEKLQKYGMDFIVAPLGRRDNKETFIKNQPPIPQELYSWELSSKVRNNVKQDALLAHLKLQNAFSLQEELAKCKQEILYFIVRLRELTKRIVEIESELQTLNANKLTEKLSSLSMTILKDKLFENYHNSQRLVLNEVKEIRIHSEEFCKQYPVVLSTTFSSRTAIPDYIFDYIIMDEASQVAIETGALALTCAKNAVIVGDTMQLPNVVTEEDRMKLNGIFNEFHVAQGYSCADYSFLQSVCSVIPDVEQTLLREHYRCHPTIINFCNQRFYGGNLLIMTEDHQENDVMMVIRTLPGHHEYNHYNQREIDVVKNEILPQLESKYTKERMQYLKGHKKISKYDSENLTFSLLEKTLSEYPEFNHLGVFCHTPLRNVFRDWSLLNEQEQMYISHYSTHLDFLIINHVTKKPVLAIETDGYTYHNDETEQHQRDLLKNHILEVYNLPLLRLKTNESGEKEKIIFSLKSIIS